MTRQEKDIQLGKYKSLCERIFMRSDQITKWESLATKITPTLSDMPKAQSNTSKIETGVEEIDELCNLILSEMGSLISERKKITTAIQTVPQEMYRNLLERFYLDGQELERIANDKNYSYDRVRHMKGEALDMLKIGKDSTP